MSSSSAAVAAPPQPQAKPKLAVKSAAPRPANAYDFLRADALREFFANDPRVAQRFNDPLGIERKPFEARVTPTEELLERLAVQFENALVNLAHGALARFEAHLQQSSRDPDDSFASQCEAGADFLVLQ